MLYFMWCDVQELMSPKPDNNRIAMLALLVFLPWIVAGLWLMGWGFLRRRQRLAAIGLTLVSPIVLLFVAGICVQIVRMMHR